MRIQVRSMTDAVRIKKVLATRKIGATVIQTAGANRGGCGYALQVPDAALPAAEQAAKALGIQILGVLRSDGG